MCGEWRSPIVMSAVCYRAPSRENERNMMNNTSHHNRNNLMCFFPGGNCVCHHGSSDSCEKLLNGNSHRAPQGKSPKTVDIPFYNEDNTMVTVSIEKYLRAFDLCHILCIKNRVRRSPDWRLVEYWPDYGYTRIVENTEDVLAVHKRLMRLTGKRGKLYFIKSPVIDEELVKGLPIEYDDLDNGSDVDNDLEAYSEDKENLYDIESENSLAELHEMKDEGPQKDEAAFRQLLKEDDLYHNNDLKISRVAMDFTGREGKIIEDPEEAEAIATAQGFQENGKSQAKCKNVYKQPWFHENLTKEQAAQILHETKQQNGIFVIHTSDGNSGPYFLSYKARGSVFHLEILLEYLDDLKRNVFTIDDGRTKFYKISQMVDFYTLNTGCLYTNLTSYIANK